MRLISWMDGVRACLSRLTLRNSARNRRSRHSLERRTFSGWVAAAESLENRTLLSAGTLDASFGAAGLGLVATDIGGDESIAGVALQSDGKIVVAGSSFTNAGTQEIFLARYNTDGSPDDGSTSDLTPGDRFGQAGDGGIVHYQSLTTDVVDAVKIQNDGKILVSGSAADQPFGNQILIARFNANGTIDSGFGDNGVVRKDFVRDFSAMNSDDDRSGGEEISGLALQDDGKIIGIGTFSWKSLGPDTPRELFLIRLNTDGSFDDGSACDSTPGDSFGTGADGTARAPNLVGISVAVLPDGKIAAWRV